MAGSTMAPSISSRPTMARRKSPRSFPGLFPNLLANGASGIAVGMATSIPPHNVAELIDAATLLIDQPDADPRRIDAMCARSGLSDRRADRRF